MRLSISRLFTNEALLDALASLASRYAESYTNVEYEFVASDLDFTEDAYGLFEMNAEIEELLIKPAAIKDLLSAGLRIDWLNVDFGDLNGILDLLQEEGTDGIRNIEYILETDAIVAILDKVLNLETDPIGIRSYYTLVLNEFLPQLGINALALLEVTEELITLRDVVDENGILDVGHIVAILDAFALVDLNQGFTADTIFDFLNADENNNGVEDYEDIFASNIVVSLLTNVLKEEAVLDFADTFLTNFIDRIILLNDLDLDVAPVIDVIGQIVDENGNFDYMDVRRVFTTLEHLGVESFNDFGNIGLDALYVLVETDEDGTDGLRFVAETKIVRYLLDAVLKQEDLIPWGLQFASDRIPGIDLTSIDFAFDGYDDVEGVLSVDHLYEFLLAGAAIEIDDILSGTFAFEYIYKYLDEPFSNVAGDRLDHVYNSLILTDLLEAVIENEDLQNYAIDLANPQLEAAVQAIYPTLTVREVTREDLDLTYELFNEASIRSLIEAIENTGIISLTQVYNLDANKLEELFELTTTDQKAMALLESPLVNHLLSKVMVSDIWSDVAAQYVNLVLEPYNVAIEAELLALDESLVDAEGMIAAEHFYDVLVAAYAVLSSGTQFTPEYFRNLEATMTIAGADQMRVDFILDSEIVHSYIDRALTSQDVKEFAADFLGQQIQAYGYAYAIDPNLLGVPEIALDENGRLNRSEIHAVLGAFNELRLNSFDELNDFTDLTVVYDKLVDSEAIEKLFESKWLHHGLSDLLTSDSSLELAAAYAEAYLREFVGISYNFDPEAFDLSDDVYGIFELDLESVKDLIKVSEAKQLILAATRIDWLTLQLTNTIADADTILGLLTAVGDDGRTNIEFMLESNILMAVFDRALNFEYSPLGLDEVIVDYANAVFRTIPEYNGLVITTDILDYDDRAFDENNVLKASEIITIVEAVGLLELETLDVDQLYQLVLDETFDDLFASYIVHSLISNVLLDADVRAFATAQVNGLQDFLDVPESFLEIDPLLLDGDVIKVEEFENLVVALHALGITDNASFTTINVDNFTSLVGGDVALDGTDNLDRVLASNFLYILLDKVMQYEGLSDYINDVLSDTLDATITDVDLSIPDTIIGNAVDHDDIEVGRVTKDEFRNIFVSVDLIGLQGLIDGEEFGFERLTDLVDPSDPNDDFQTLLASDYIYVVLSRLLESEDLSNAVASYANDLFGSDTNVLVLGAPADAKGTDMESVEFELMTRAEWRQLMISFKLLDIVGIPDEESLSIATIMDMLGRNEDAGIDDFDRFLESLYIQDKLSNLLLSDGIIELIAGDLFDPADFVIPDSAIIVTSGEERLAVQELYDLFYGLDLLGIEDFETDTLGVDTITGLESADVDALLDSTYIYVLVDLVIKNQEDIEVPLAAFEDGGNFDGMIKKDEIRDVFKALDLLGIDDLENIDPETITIAQIQDVLDGTNSSIVNYILSQAIIEAVDPDEEDIVPLDAFVDNDRTTGMLTAAELTAVIDAVAGLVDDPNTDTIGDIDFAVITVGQVTSLRGTESYVIKQLVTDSIEDVITDLGTTIPVEAYDGDRFSDTEFEALIDAIEALAHRGTSDLTQRHGILRDQATPYRFD